ncbi:MAG TPA: twin-arginine translocase TatA/TatE family subunit [Acidobacteriaceae bacterium]|nr:twin-arginine translocase TatA/TatE family subunit [Acidobacteriaceae bacterium]
MHFGDSIFIFLLALVLFGPKKLPEIGRQVGKLLAEFRRASNEFKFQIQEEIRQMEDEERRKKLEESRPAAAAAAPTAEIPPPPAIVAQPEVQTAPTIQPPSTGETVSTARPFATPAEAALDTISSGEPNEAAQISTEVGSVNGTHAPVAEVSEEESVHHD